MRHLSIVNQQVDGLYCSVGCCDLFLHISFEVKFYVIIAFSITFSTHETLDILHVL